PTAPTQGRFADPMPAAYQMIDDVLVYSDECASFIRLRNLWSTAGVPGTTGISGGDGAPGEIRAHLRSGLELLLTDYAPGAKPSGPLGQPAPVPNPPTRGKASIAMPSGASFVIDEPSTGQCTLLFTHPTGASISVDATGNIVVTAATGKKASIIASDVELASDSGAADAHKVSLKADLTALKTYLDSHTHTGVQTGAG